MTITNCKGGGRCNNRDKGEISVGYYRVHGCVDRPLQKVSDLRFGEI
jgi:hypothetical protein